MIEKDNGFGTADVYCDFCELEEHFDNVDMDGRLDWGRLMDAMKASGWLKIKKSDGSWEHMCPVCVERKGSDDN